MCHHVKKLMFTVRVDEPDPRFGNRGLHHAGAVQMADAEWDSSGDPRLRLMAHTMRHEQQGEIASMHGINGVDAVRQATRNILAYNL
jgi:uncharacterized protein (DUF305 family)